MEIDRFADHNFAHSSILDIYISFSYVAGAIEAITRDIGVDMAELAKTGGVAVVTGAGGGIGAGIARAAALAGMTVVAADIAADRLDAAVAGIRALGGDAHAHVTDVSDEASVMALADAARRFGAIRLLVNNAAVEVLGQVWEVPAATWRRAFDINVFGIANGLRAFVPGMIARGEPAWVANVASVGMLGALPFQGAYIATKASIVAMTEALKLEIDMIGAPITVSAVLPGGVATRILHDAYVNEQEDQSGGWLKDMRDSMNGLMPPDQAGEIIFEGIASGTFWVSTHPDILATLARIRGEQFSGLTPPRNFEATGSETWNADGEG